MWRMRCSVLGEITYDGVELNLDKPFERISMKDAVKKYAGVDFDAVETLAGAQALAKEHHVEFEPHHLKGDILNLFFEQFAEEKLVQPTFLTGHPVEISTAGQAQGGRTRIHGTVRAVYQRQRICKRFFRTE